MTGDAWRDTLLVALALNAVVGFGYRVYRLSKGGPIADVWGQAILGGVLAVIAGLIAIGVTWVRWIALLYAAVFAIVVMPVWVLGVLLPLKPRAIDYAFTAFYWAALVVIGVAVVAI